MIWPADQLQAAIETINDQVAGKRAPYNIPGEEGAAPPLDPGQPTHRTAADGLGAPPALAGRRTAIRKSWRQQKGYRR